MHQVVEEPGPTKQRVMCGGRGAWEVISDHPDMEARGRRAETSRAPPRLDLVLSPPPTTVLVMEITASMAENQDWKHINKAAHNLIKYDLPDTARLAVVSFANTSRVEAGVTQLRGSRGHLADTVPDKFRLDTGGGEARCVACGVRTAVTEVLGEGRAGAHLILVTRAGPDTLSPTEMATLREYVEYYQVIIKIRVFWGNNAAGHISCLLLLDIVCFFCHHASSFMPIIFVTQRQNNFQDFTTLFTLPLITSANKHSSTRHCSV